MTETDRAIKELELVGLFDKDSDYSGMTGNAVKELLEVFQAQGHSGASAGLVASIFNKFATGGILSPLTGKEDEWVDMSGPSGKPLFQNKRASHIFAADCYGRNAFDINGKNSKTRPETTGRIHPATHQLHSRTHQQQRL